MSSISVCGIQLQSDRCNFNSGDGGSGSKLQLTARWHSVGLSSFPPVPGCKCIRLVLRGVHLSSFGRSDLVDSEYLSRFTNSEQCRLQLMHTGAAAGFGAADSFGKVDSNNKSRRIAPTVERTSRRHQPCWAATTAHGVFTALLGEAGSSA